MRRPNSALASAVLGTALVASTVTAQMSPPTSAPGPGGEGTASVPASVTASPADAPMNPARGARSLLRNGWDYITYQEFERALQFFREAERRQNELNDAERTKLKQGIERAQRGLRETAMGVKNEKTYAMSGGLRRPGALAVARPAAAAGSVATAVASAPATAPAPGSPTPAPRYEREPIQLAGGGGANLNLQPATEPAQVQPPPQAAMPLTVAARVVAPAPTAEPVEAPAPVVDTAPAPAPAPVQVPAAEPVAVATPAETPAPVESPAPMPTPPVVEEKEKEVEGVPLPRFEPRPEAGTAAPVPAPASAPAPVPATADQDLKPAATAPAAEPSGSLPELPPPPQDVPLPIPANRLPAPAPASSLPNPGVPAPMPAPVAMPTADEEPLVPLPASLAERARPEPPAAEPAPAPSPAPVAVPVASPTPAPVAETTPAAVPEIAPAPPQHPLAGLPVSTPGEPSPMPAAAAIAPDLPPAPPAEEIPAPAPSAAPSATPGLLTNGGGRASTLTPELQAEVAKMAQRQEDEFRQRPTTPPPTTTTAPGDVPLPLSPTGTSSSRLEISRAPSPTEARPIKGIPVPEEFVPLPKREWEPNRKYWAAAATCHLPLYFQDASLERYGYSMEQRFGPAGRYLSYPLDDPRQSKQRNQLIQPMFSAALFAFQVGMLPYNLIMDPPWEAEYDLGYYRPGDRVPTDVYYLPLTGVGPPLRGKNYGEPAGRGYNSANGPAAYPTPRW